MIARTFRFSPLVAVAILLATALPVPTASAALNMAAPNGGVAFTFSNGLASATLAAQTLEARGFVGTFYVGSATLRQGPYYGAYLSASDVANLSARGHEIGSMGASQMDLTTATSAQLLSELSGSQASLQSITGVPVRDLAYPYGSVNDTVVATAGAYYASGRTLTTDPASFTGTVDAYRMPALLMSQALNVSIAKADVDYAIANHVYVVLAFGAISATPGPYDWTPSDLDALAAYVQTKGVAVATVAQIVGGVTPPAPTTPSAPVLGAVASNGTVNLTWTTPYNGGSPITGYNLTRATSSGAETAFRAVGATNAFTDTNVTNGQTYYYRIAAVNGLGIGLAANETSATPRPPSLPSGARIAYTFDNGYAGGVAAAQILEAQGFHGTFYASSGLLRIGAYYADYMSASDLAGLAMRGHDVGSMTVDQKDLTTLSAANLSAELTNSQLALQAILGAPVRDLAYPYGSVNPTVAAAAAAGYASARTLTGSVNDFTLPIADSFHRPGLMITDSTTLATAQGYVDFAIANNVTVVLEFGRIVATPGGNLDKLVGYVKAKGVPVVTMAQIVAGTPPPAPTTPSAPSLSVIPVKQQVNLLWKAPDNNGAALSGYKLYRGTTSGGETLLATLTPAQLAYNDTNLKNQQTYYYQISATNAMGEGPRSGEMRAVPTETGVPPGAAVVFTFDDGLVSQMASQKVLDSKLFKATYFIIPTNLSNPSTGDNPEGMTVANVQALAADGMDMESHTDNHVDQTALTDAQLVASLGGGQSDLQNITGMPANYLAWPLGVSDARTQAVAAQYYKGARSYGTDLGVAESHTTNPYAVPAFGLTTNDTEQTTRAYVDYAISHNQTIIFVIHNLAPVPKSAGVVLDQWDWNLDAFKKLVEYVDHTKVPVLTVAQLGAQGRWPPN